MSLPTHKAIRVALHLLLFFVAGTAFTCIASAELPVPGPQDQFLIGIRKIIITANAPFDVELITDKEKLPSVDYLSIEQAIVRQFKETLPESTIGNIQFETASPNKPSSIADEDTLLLHFAIGYHVAKLVDKEIVLGAIYPTIERPLPPALKSDRTSGFHRRMTGLPPAPFVLSEDGIPLTMEMRNAVRRATGSVADWLGHTPMEDSRDTKN
jgi:hypothetical protein